MSLSKDIPQKKISIADLRDMVSDPGMIGIICHRLRPGFPRFASELELTWFPPDNTELNAFFTLVDVPFAEQDWWLIIIPEVVKEIAEVLATKYALRFIRGVPVSWEVRKNVVAIGAVRENKYADGGAPPGLTWFPLKGENLFTLEHTDAKAATMRPLQPLTDMEEATLDREAARAMHEAFKARRKR